MNNFEQVLKLKIWIQFLYCFEQPVIMVRRIASEEEIEKQKKDHKLRIRISKAARRSGKIKKNEGKVRQSKAKSKSPRSQKRIATIKKSRY